MDYVFQVLTRKEFDYSHGPRDVYGIFIVLDGQFSCTLGGTEYIISRNEAWMFPKDMYFERRVLGGSVRYICISFSDNTQNLTPGYLRTADPERFHTTVRHMEKAISEENDFLVQHLLRDFLLMHRLTRDSAVRDDTVNDCIAYFAEHYTEPIRLSELANRYSITSQGLIYKFKKAVSKTPIEYLSSVRISQSKRLLRDSSITVTEIAEACGFENVYYFSNAFKRASGMSPSAYRNLTQA